MKGLTQATIDAANAKVELVSEPSLVAGKEVLTTQIASATEQVEKASKKEVTKEEVAKDSKVVEKSEPIIKPTSELINTTELETTVTEKIVKLVSLKKNAEEVASNAELTIGDTMNVAFGLAIPAMKYKAGTTYTFDLPSQLHIGNYNGGTVGSLGRYKVENNKVIVTFSEIVETDVASTTAACDAAGLEGYTDENGNATDGKGIGWLCGGMNFEVTLKSNNTNNSNQIIDFSDILGDKKYEVILLPNVLGNKGVEKTAIKGKLDATGVFTRVDAGANAIQWSVDVNTNLKSEAGKKFTDTYNTNELDSITNFAVTELNIALDGTITKGSLVPNVQYNEGWTLPEKKAYRITYVTKIKNQNSTSYTNKATLDGNGEDTEKVNFERLPLLDKKGIVTGSGDNEGASWTVVYNEGKQTLDTTKREITDELENIHSYDTTSLIVKNASTVLIKDTDYTVSFRPNDTTTRGGGKNKMVITLNSSAGDADETFMITYKTKLNDSIIDNTVTLGNKVSAPDYKGDIKEAKVGSLKTYSQNTLHKEIVSIDYTTQKIKWKIDINQAGYDMTGAQIIDTLGEGLTYVEKSAILNGQPHEPAVDVSGKVLTFPPTQYTKNQTLTYETSFSTNIFRGKYENNATIGWEKKQIIRTNTIQVHMIYIKSNQQQKIMDIKLLRLMVMQQRDIYSTIK